MKEFLLLGLSVGLSHALPGLAQTYPTKPIRTLVTVAGSEVFRATGSPASFLVLAAKV